MFHKMKQKALELATGEWILQLDADEAITEELKVEIVNLLNGQIARNNSNNLAIEQLPIAFWIPRVNYLLGEDSRKVASILTIQSVYIKMEWRGFPVRAHMNKSK